LPLDEAVKRYVKPKMKLHLAGGIGGPSAAICEIIRQYWGENPEFILIQSTLSGQALNLVHCNFIKKLIFAACVDISDSVRPSEIIRRSYEEKKIDLENWSLFSLQQKLMAGALGIPFMPTKSILGSSMVLDKEESFREIDDPFNLESKVGVVKALNPDFSIVHGCVADVQGNTILPAPYGDDLWGPLASSNGVLVTVEKIVPTDFIRKYSALVKIPSFVVSAVSITPLGMHPFSCPDPGISDFESYGQDIDFLNELHRASKDNQKLEDWIRRWVVECPTHEYYLNKLGGHRIRTLKEKGTKDILCDDFPSKFTNISQDLVPQESIDQETMMLIVVAREVIRSVWKSGHRTVLVGGGSRSIAAWLAYYQLKNQECEIELIIGNGQIGYTPKRGESINQSIAVIRSSKMLTDTIMTQGIFVGGKNNKCLSVLGGGQIDRYGNINSTTTLDGRFLVGSGGANDAVNAQEVIVAIDQSRNRFVEKLPYITCPGNRVTTVVSTMGVFRKMRAGEELYLVACFPNPQLSTLEEKIKHIQNNCGWPLRLANNVEEVSKPTQLELELRHWLLSPPSSRADGRGNT
jgi:acyl CoA:acetate/3-ketoacid CoA transferase alpha subunit/acyl CoA:acetate/3-ketoacid CoA transferase beta subunit